MTADFGNSKTQTQISRRRIQGLKEHEFPIELIFLRYGRPCYLKITWDLKFRCWKVYYLSECLRATNFFYEHRDELFMHSWIAGMFGVVSVP